MPTALRLDWPGALHHVMTRGHAKDDIFLSDEDRTEWISIARRVFEESGCKCFAWALMPNHTHTQLETGKLRLSRVMGRINSSYARYFNRRHERVGYVFQGRFRSVSVEDEAYFLQLISYVHLNPVRAGLVDLKGLAEYPWTGHAALMGRRPARMIDADATLARFGKTRSSARRELVRWMETELDRSPEGEAVPALDGELVGLTERDRDDLELRRVAALAGRDEYLHRVTRDSDQRSWWRARFRAGGVDRQGVFARACDEFGADPVAVAHGRRTRAEAKARALAAYLMCEYLGTPHEAAGRQLGVSRRAVVDAATRGRELARQLGVEPASFFT